MKKDQIDFIDSLSYIPEIYDCFKEKYRESFLSYNGFIASLGIGVKTFISEENENDYGKKIYTDRYLIVDEHKFMLSRLKYGF
jgi:hypothetical protein